MKYEERVDRVIDYIGKNLDEDLKLEELCRIACFSKYHFHRLFTAHTGLPLNSYIKWLRLKRAAHQLIALKEDSIVNVAFGAGFETHESFSRAFKQIGGQSPSSFRKNPNWINWEKPPLLLKIGGKKIMDVLIKDLPSRRLALVEHHGDPMKMSGTLDRLITWAKSQPIDLKPKAGDAFGFAYSDPKETTPEEFRFDLALTVPDKHKLSDEVSEKILPAGRYAVVTHKGSRENIAETIYGLYRDWLPESGEELGDLPCIFCYQNFDYEVAESELLTDLWVLLK